MAEQFAFVHQFAQLQDQVHGQDQLTVDQDNVHQEQADAQVIELESSNEAQLEDQHDQFTGTVAGTQPVQLWTYHESHEILQLHQVLPVKSQDLDQVQFVTVQPVDAEHQLRDQDHLIAEVESRIIFHHFAQDPKSTYFVHKSIPKVEFESVIE